MSLPDKNRTAVGKMLLLLLNMPDILKAEGAHPELTFANGFFHFSSLSLNTLNGSSIVMAVPFYCTLMAAFFSAHLYHQASWQTHALQSGEILIFYNPLLSAFRFSDFQTGEVLSIQICCSNT